MSMSIKLLTVILITFFLSACGGGESPKDLKQKSALEKTLKPQLDAIEKAEKIDDDIQKSFEARDKKMRDNGI